MYLPPDTVDTILSFIVGNAGPGSGVLFDYPGMSLIDGTDNSEIAKNFRERVTQLGEPLRFGIPDMSVISFLHTRGFGRVENLTPAEGNARYFQGRNASRPMCSLFSFVHAEIPRGGNDSLDTVRISGCQEGLH